MDRADFDKLWGSIEDARKRREKNLPTEQHCLRAMHDAYERLKELGWNDMIYAPKGEKVETISVGSTGIHPATWMDGARDGLWWIHDGGDLWPGYPVMYRKTAAELERWAKIRERWDAPSAASVDGSPQGGDDLSAPSRSDDSAVPAEEQADAQPTEGSEQ